MSRRHQKEKFVEKKSQENFEKLVFAVKQRFRLKDSDIFDCYERINSIPIEILVERSAYHSKCYKKVTHTTNIDRLLKRREKLIATDPEVHGEADDDETSTTLSQEHKGLVTSEKTLRSRAQAYNKSYCIICQNKGGKLHKVEYFKTGKRMLEVSKVLPDQGFFIRMNTIPNSSDAVANDVQYHLVCWVNAQRAAQNIESKNEETQELEDLSRVIADVEIIEIVKLNYSGEDGAVMDMNNINKTYNNLIGNNEDGEINYKRYLKALLKDNIPDLIFSRPPNRRSSEKPCSSSYQAKAVDAFTKSSDSYATIFEAAKIIRNEVLQHRNWKFSGDYTGFILPRSLSSLLRWIIIGPKTTVDSSLIRKQAIDSRVNNISQIIVKATKSKRQMTHSTTFDSNFREVVETPFAVGLGIHVHKETRNKKLIKYLSDLGLSISYDNIMKIENDLANAVLDNIEKNRGVFVPPNIEIGRPLHFALDNIDFKNDTVDGKSEFHGTTHVAFQNNSNVTTELLKITRSRSLTYEDASIVLTDSCSKPNPPNESFPNFIPPYSEIQVSLFKNVDQVWGLCQVIDEVNICQLPTWSAFNSILTEEPQKTLSQVLPLYPGSPTDWGNLYTALKIVQGINVSVTGKKRTIVTLDLQLYSKCMQLRQKDEIKENFIFRLGELHIVFAFLKVIGKYILGSGLDQVLLEADIYGPTTLGQILEGKHMKRGMEAHMINYLSLYKIYLDKALASHPQLRSKINKKVSQLSLHLKAENNTLKNEFAALVTECERNGFLEVLKDFDKSLHQQARFLRNYMSMYEVLLQFVRASREGCWELHLYALNAMVPYFFAHDQLNYARLSPLYLATMTELQDNDVDSWLYLKNNFSVSKSGIPFCSIGTDHALEQENKVMKVTGGVKGLTQNPTALHRFCLVTPILNALSSTFCEENNIKGDQRKQHYQLAGTANTRIRTNVKRLIEVFSKFDIDFRESTSVFNLVSRAVLPEEVASEFLNHQNIGEKLYHTFLTDRLYGETSIWSPMKKKNLKSFRSIAKVIKSKADQKVIQLKEERTLLSRFLITARKRPDLNLEESIGNYEFSVVPKSLFTEDGQPLPTSDKAKVLHELEKMAIITESEYISNSLSVIIIDGMALVNKVHKDDSVKTWKEFAEKFVSLLKNVSQDCSEIRLVFDRYIQQSLKSRTRRKRTSGKEIKYEVCDTADISKKSLKQLLGHIETKQALTEYLAHYTKHALGNTIPFSVTYSKISETNISSFTEEMKKHDHEEADTLLILHAIDVAKNDPFKECIVLSPDTDVFLLLVHYYQLLPNVTYFRTGRGDKERDISIRKCYEAIGEKRAEAILSFHVLTGCDQIGRFSGKSKTSWWNQFMKADEDILRALANLGIGEALSDLYTLDHIERFVVNTYGSTNMPNDINTLARLRWYLFSKFQYDAAQLPPTVSALKYKIFRSHFVCLVLKRSHIPIQNLPSPESYGWEINGTSLDPILTDKLPAPIALIELSVCRCTRDCTTRRCKCFKNDLVCTDMCKCFECKNDNSYKEEESEIPESDVSDTEEY